eukprot:13183587-Ditylum_brightwellii.AAC.1
MLQMNNITLKLISCQAVNVAAHLMLIHETNYKYNTNKLKAGPSLFWYFAADTVEVDKHV